MRPSVTTRHTEFLELFPLARKAPFSGNIDFSGNHKRLALAWLENQVGQKRLGKGDLTSLARQKCNMKVVPVETSDVSNGSADYDLPREWMVIAEFVPWAPDDNFINVWIMDVFVDASCMHAYSRYIELMKKKIFSNEDRQQTLWQGAPLKG